MKQSVMTTVKLNKFKPRSYQIDFLKAMESKKYKRALLIWPRRCLSGDTHIIMANGSYKLLRDISVGDKILSWDGASFVPDIIKDKWETGLKETITLQSFAHPCVTTSHDHLFAVTNPVAKKHYWRKAKDIRSQSLLTYQGSSFTGLSQPLLAEFLGYLLSDGYISGYQQPKFTNTNPVILDRVEELALKLFEVKIIRRKKGNGFDMGFSNGTLGGGAFSNPIKELFRDHGLDVPKYERRLLPLLWDLDEESVGRFFAGIISGDGNLYYRDSTKVFESGKSIEGGSEISINAGASSEYAWDLYWLLRKFGINPQVPRREKINNWKIRIAKGHDIYKLLSFGRIYGKEGAQERLLKQIDHSRLKITLWNGCHRHKAKKKEGRSQVLYDIETEKNHNFIANGYVVHNSGKDVLAFNYCIRECLKSPIVSFYVLPTYSQGRKIIFDSLISTGERFLDFIPSELIESINQQEMKIRFKNQSLLQVVGSDNVDTLVGTNPKLLVFSEYALQDPRAYTFLRPILVANGGTAIFVSTPRGRNSLFTLYEVARNSPDWYCSKLSVVDTGHISLEDIEKERAEGLISEDLIQQEYFTSFSLGIEGGYYTKYVDKMRLEERITDVPYESGFKVHTAWDLGMSDSTCIIFYQKIGTTLRIIDCYENASQGLEHYAKVIQGKPYVYGKHFAPHDIKVRELGTGISRLEKARELGIDFVVLDNLPVMDGIESVRSMMSYLWIDEKRCAPLIKAMENYRREYDSKRQTYKDNPLHDFSSHFSDALRYLAVSLPKSSDSMTAEELEQRYQRAVYGSSNDLPPFFRDTKGYY